MADKILGTLAAEEFEQLLTAFIERAEPDTMSFAAFDQAAHRLAEDAITETIELTGVIEGDEIVFDATEAAPVFTQGNEVLVGGLRLVVRLRQPAVR
jgi:hypothetical protein